MNIDAALLAALGVLLFSALRVAVEESGRWRLVWRCLACRHDLHMVERAVRPLEVSVGPAMLATSDECRCRVAVV